MSMERSDIQGKLTESFSILTSFQILTELVTPGVILCLYRFQKVFLQTIFGYHEINFIVGLDEDFDFEFIGSSLKQTGTGITD